MVPRSRWIGWCIVLAWSLAGFGCSQLTRRTATEEPKAPAAPDAPPTMSIPSGVPAPAPLPAQIAANGETSLLPWDTDNPVVVANATAPYQVQSSPPSKVVATEVPSTRAILAEPQGAPSRLEASVQNAAPLRPIADSPFRNLYRMAAGRFAATPGYNALFKRRELVDGKERPEELIIVKYRKDPASIYMRWVGNEAKDREVLYVKGKYDDMLHIAPGKNDSVFATTNSRQVLLRPDTARGLGKERYPVTGISVHALIEQYGQLVDAVEHGAKVGNLKYLEGITRPESEVPLDAVLHVIPPGVDPTLPKGGQRLWFFDPSLHFPVLVIAHDSQGREEEYYFYDKFMFPGHIQDEQFSPAAIGHR